MPPDSRFFAPEGPFTISQLAEISGATIERDNSENRVYSNVAPLDDAERNDVGFLDNKAYIDQFRETSAGCCIVEARYLSQAPEGLSLLVVDTPYLAYAKVATAFHPSAEMSYCPTASDELVHPSAAIGAGSVIGAGTVVGPNAEIGRNCIVAPNCYIGDAVRIGDNCRIGALVSVRFSILGNNVSLFSGARIGEPGFGFAASPTGAVTVPQVGRVLIGDGVEIGANSTIDRGAGPDTVIGAGTRIDNLVQIGHNVRIGKGCIIVAQTGIAGSANIGDGVQVGGQVGIAGHLNIGDGVRIAAQSGVMRDVEPGIAVGGTPAMPIKKLFREIAALARLANEKGR